MNGPLYLTVYRRYRELILDGTLPPRTVMNGPLYLTVYRRYRELILDGTLPPGTKMPSLRTCARELKLSRTTIESAYLQLAADGYIIAKAQSGYYVTDIGEKRKKEENAPQRETPAYRFDFASSGADRESFRFDLWRRYMKSALRQDSRLLSYGEPQGEPDFRQVFASSGADRESFRFDLWRRYMKSALRQDSRLLSYGEPQGEPDFRQVLSTYVRERRNILCSPDSIVVGAGVQNLLQILCPLIKDRETVSFPTPSFVQGSTVFSDFGFQIQYRNKNAHVIYVSPAHMTKWGEIMPVKRRLELIHHADAQGSLIIEDDFENEFVYLQKPTPSLYSLAGGENVVYIGSFSKLLLPSIRLSFMILPPPLLEAYRKKAAFYNQTAVYIGSFSKLLLPSIRLSFMILPPPLLEAYRKKAAFYNQTASKAEQIALCQFIRDGHLTSQTRKLKRLYSQKLKTLQKDIKSVFGENCLCQFIRDGHLTSQTRKLKRLYSQKLKTLQKDIKSVFGENCPLRTGAAGTSLALTLPFSGSSSELKEKAEQCGLALSFLKEKEQETTVVLSCSSMPSEDFLPALKLLYSLCRD